MSAKAYNCRSSCSDNAIWPPRSRSRNCINVDVHSIAVGKRPRLDQAATYLCVC